MALSSSDLVLRRSTGVSDTTPSANGLSLSPNEIGTGYFATIYDSVRVAGSTSYRKIFLKNINRDLATQRKDLSITAKAWVKRPGTAGNHNISGPIAAPESESNIGIRAGTATDTQADISGQTFWPGVAWLSGNLAATNSMMYLKTEAPPSTAFLLGQSTPVVLCQYDSLGELTYSHFGTTTLTAHSQPLIAPHAVSGFIHPSPGIEILHAKAHVGWYPAVAPNILGPYYIGDSRYADWEIDEFKGHQLYVGASPVAPNGTCTCWEAHAPGELRTIVGNTRNTIYVTPDFSPAITLPSVSPMAYAYVISTYVSQVIELGTVECSHGTPITNLGTGISFSQYLDFYDHPVGAIDQHWEIRFLSGQYSVTGNTVGLVAQGPVSSLTSMGLSPINVNEGGYYFEMAAAGWTLTVAPESASGVIVVDTLGSSKSIWVRHHAQAGVVPDMNNMAEIMFSGEAV